MCFFPVLTWQLQVDALVWASVFPQVSRDAEEHPTECRSNTLNFRGIKALHFHSLTPSALIDFMVE